MIFKYLRNIAIIGLIFLMSMYTSSSIINEPVYLNVLMPAPFAESTSNLVNQFNIKEEGRIHINVTKGPKETEAVSDLAISSLLLGNSPFDILLMDVTWLPKYAEAGWLEPLDHWINSNDWSAIADGARVGNEYNGQIYRWPLTADMGLLYWRKDLMEQAPKTPEELINISLKLKRDGRVLYGYVWQGRQYEGLSCVFLEVLNGFGGEWLNNSQKVKLGGVEAIDAAKWLNNLIISGASPKSVTNFFENEALQAFESGEAALMRNWPYAWAELQKDNSAVKGKVGITTMISNNDKEPSSTLGSWGLSILKGSKNKNEAYKFINYITTKAAQKELFLESGYTPTIAKLYKDEELLKNSPILNQLEKALALTKSRPQTPLYAQISDVLQKQLSAILTDNMAPNLAMDLAQEKTERIISSTSKR